MAGWVQAEEFAFVGARANGMGGANAASTRDATAQFLNPAAFGFFGRSEWKGNAADNGNLSDQGFSWEILGIGAGFTMTEDMGRYLDILANIDFSTFDQGTLSAAEKNVDSLLTMAAVLGSLTPGDALYADVSAGTSVQIGHFGVGVRMFGEAAAWTQADRDNLSLDSFPNVAALVTEIQNAANNASFTWDGSYRLSDEQRASLASALGNISTSDDAIKFLDSKLGDLQASGKLDGSEIAKAVDLFNNLVPTAGSGVIGSNQTAVVGNGFALVEIPISYGWAMNENLSFGITAKAMYGTVLGTKLWIFNENNDQILENISDNYESSMNFGLDLGALYRIPKFQFALVGHNLNSPTFSGFTETVPLNGNPQQVTIPDVEIDPQVTFGAAFMPTKRITLESNLDLLEIGTLLNDYNIQRLSVGGEFDMSLLALRLGAYKNLAEDWQDWVATAGVGLDLFGFRIDVGGAYSLGESVDYRGTAIPAEARLYASLGLDF
jgi:hypothetical protein